MKSGTALREIFMTDKTQAMKLALGKIKSARDCHPNAVDTLLFEAEEILEEALAKPDFWEGYVPEPVKLAQCAPAEDGVCVQSGLRAEQPSQQKSKKLKVTLEDRPIDIELAQYKRMFNAACSALGSIGDSLGVDPEEGGAEPILAAIAELKSCATCEALARTVMLDQTSHDTSQPAQRKPLTPEQIEPIAIDVLGYGALRGQDMELFTQSVRAIEAAHGITKGNT
jgi:hypothetical protein